MAQVIIVSNRLPVTVKKVDGMLEFSESMGGLATGLASFVKGQKNRWIGWPGIASDELTEEDRTTIAAELAKDNCYPVFLTQKQIDEFYNGYSNRILWPLFHNMPPNLEDWRKGWRAYRKVNKLFADAVLALADSKSTIWVHDYQLILLPELLRRERPHDNIGFFLHIPFPTPQVFDELQGDKKLLHGMLGADLIGFHTAAYADNFLETCQQLEAHTVLRDQVLLEKRVVQVTDFPMGIDYDKYAKAARTREVRQAVRHYKKKYRGRKVIVAVDRLDPTKGLVERLEAYREFLETNPQFHGKVVLAMVAAPSRTDIPEYQELKKRIESLVKQINNTLGWPKWQPIDYIRGLPFEGVAALYRVADIAFIAPLRDGMNLVAKEYVAAKRRRGVLILSETAGAAQELTEALLVDPGKPNTEVAALYQAVSMSRHELKKRLKSMKKQLQGHTVHTWASAFLRSLERPLPAPTNRTSALNNSKQQRVVVDAYRSAGKRLLLLDYDGVLVPLSANFKDTAPPARLLKVIAKLVADERNEVVVVSGRSRQNLDEWFGNNPVNLVAEHGAFFRNKDGSWHKPRSHSTTWKSLIRPIMEKYEQRTPGASIEEKTNSLVWHYRSSPAYEAQKYTVVLRRVLQSVVKDYGLAVHSGNKILEVKDPTTSKALAVERWLKRSHDFVLAVGDDYTDEDMFAALPDSAYTIKVGRGRTHARYRLQSSKEVQELLKRLVR